MGFDQHRNLTSGRLLAGNAIWNFIGTCSPMAVAIICLPILKRSLGTDRLGIITLAWVVVGYFGLFDFGLSRALTKLVAERAGQKRFEEIPSLIWTSLVLLSGIGVLGAVLVFSLTPWLVKGPLKVPLSLRQETLISFYWLACSLPVVTVTAGLRGVLEAFQRFRLATAIRVPMGVFTYLGPVLVLPFSDSLVPVIAALVLGRTLAGVAHVWACFRAVPDLRSRIHLHSSALRPLIHFGSWMTVSNIVGPLMVTFDRFVIGSMISITAVTYYAIPYEVVTKLWMVPGAVVGVLFPAFSTTQTTDQSRLAFLFECGTRYIYIFIFPITLVLIAFAPEGLHVWLGSEFAHNSYSVARWLAVGVFVNSLATVPFAHLQSIGRPDITAKLHLGELPVYVVLMFTLIARMGIEGAAIAWTIRVGIDALLLFGFSSRFLSSKQFVGTRLPLLLIYALTVFYLGALPLPFKAVIIAFVCTLSLLLGWFLLLLPSERNFLRLRFQPRLFWSKNAETELQSVSSQQ